MWAWSNPLDDGAKKLREEYPWPEELRYYRVIALTGWTDEEYRAQPESVINELFMMDEIVRPADRKLQAVATANELSRVIAALLGTRM